MASIELSVSDAITRELHVPDFDELRNVIQSSLERHFEKVSVKVVDCPDLTEKPFGLASAGICGSPVIADVGGVQNLAPIPNKNKIYDIKSVCSIVGAKSAFVIGPGAGPWPEVGVNCEMMANVKFDDGGDSKVDSYIAKLGSNDEAVQESIKSTKFALMANLLISEGKPGKVIEVKASKRLGNLNFVSVMREGLQTHFGDKIVGLGGCFLIENGRAKLHIMPDFPEPPLTDVNNWLKYFDIPAPLVCLSVFVSGDPGLDLRLEHTHCFGEDGKGGHFHYSTTPDEISFCGYFVPAGRLYRIDKPI